MAQRAIAVGRRRNLDYVRMGRQAPRILEMQYRFYDRHVFLPMRKVIGIENGNGAPCAHP